MTLSRRLVPAATLLAICGLSTGCGSQGKAGIGKDCSDEICFVRGDAGCFWQMPICCGGSLPQCGYADVDGRSRELKLISIDAGACVEIDYAPCM